jgi:hypothetical protein
VAAQQLLRGGPGGRRIPSGWRALGALTLIATVAVPPLGCGGGGGGGGGKPEARKQAGEGDSSAAQAIPAPDRVAYYGIATGSGTLRAVAAPLALGNAGARWDPASLQAARSRVQALRPRDPLLVRIKARLLAALSRAIATSRGAQGARKAARDALQDTDAINSGLHSYVHRHPQAAALVPD